MQNIICGCYCSIIHPWSNSWNNPNVLPTDEWINKMYYIHTTGCYLTIKKKKVLTPAITWMILENMLCEI